MNILANSAQEILTFMGFEMLNRGYENFWYYDLNCNLY